MYPDAGWIRRIKTGAGDRDRTGMASLEVLPLLIYFSLIIAHLGFDQRF